MKQHKMNTNYKATLIDNEFDSVCEDASISFKSVCVYDLLQNMLCSIEHDINLQDELIEERRIYPNQKNYIMNLLTRSEKKTLKKYQIILKQMMRDVGIMNRVFDRLDKNKKTTTPLLEGKA